MHRLYARQNPGDRLWIREIWASSGNEHETLYRAESIFDGMGPGDFGWKWRSPMFMPRRVSRLSLRVTATRIERLCAIAEADAIAEGAPKQKEDHIPLFSHRAGFERLWDSLHRKPMTRWNDNPWVVVIEFEKVAK